MAIAPIVGKLRKRLVLDLSVALGLGTAGGFVFWHTVHIPMMAKRDNYYLKYEAAKNDS